jgi:hypothetical protein
MVLFKIIIELKIFERANNDRFDLYYQSDDHIFVVNFYL